MSNTADEIDGIVAAWRRDGGVFARRATLVDRIKAWASNLRARFYTQEERDASHEQGRTVGELIERRRCLAIVTAVAREIDAETSARIAALGPGEEADNGVAVGAFRACREAYQRIAGMSEDDVAKVKEVAAESDGKVVPCG